MGVTIGGSLTILTSPSTTVHSFAKALRLSFARARARLRFHRLTSAEVASCAKRRAMSSTSRRVYQRSRLRMPAKAVIASRYERTTAWDRPWALLAVFVVWGVAWAVRRAGGLV